MPPTTARHVNLAFYRDGDFFGELSILNGSRAGRVGRSLHGLSIFSRLNPDAVRSLKQSFRNSGTLLEERLAQYKAKTEARIPLDFTTEMLPAETRPTTKWPSMGNRRPESDDEEEPFADERGIFPESAKRRIRRFEHIEQIDEMDCGAASLGMICRHFGRESQSRAVSGSFVTPPRDGTSLKAICRAAIELGLAARALKVSLRNLSVMPLPAIVHWEGNHWMVLFDVDSRRCAWPIPRSGSRESRGRNSNRIGRVTRRCLTTRRV